MPGMTLSKAFPIFLTQKSRVQVIQVVYDLVIARTIGLKSFYYQCQPQRITKIQRDYNEEIIMFHQDSTILKDFLLQLKINCKNSLNLQAKGCVPCLSPIICMKGVQLKQLMNIIPFIIQTMVRIKSIFILCITLIFFTQAEVSMRNLVQFWKETYDQNNDGHATLQEFVEFFKRMEPQHHITLEDIIPIFKFFDSNLDLKVTLKEIIELSRVKVSHQPGPKQIHIGFTNKQDQMQIMWVSAPQHYNKPVVQFGKLPGVWTGKVQGNWTTYDVGHLGFHGRIYRAVITGLQHLKRYFYRVGDQETRVFSKVKYFKSPPLRVQTLDEVNIAVFGDMGTYTPFGAFVTNQIAKDHFLKPYDFVFLTGDIAYAGVSKEKIGQLEPVWDLYGQLTEKFSAYTAFMPGVGNHERFYNYTSYMKRYVLPRMNPHQTNLWFSFDYGQVHVAHFSSEHPYNLGSQQYDYLEEDLKKARSNPNIKWIIVGVHRAFYSSLNNQYSNVTGLAFHLEDLMNKYDVDIVQTGHLHDYERSWPTYKGKAMKQKANLTHYMSPQHPVYVVQGTAGALVKGKFVTPTPDWSCKRALQYGYGRITIKGNRLRYQYITIPSGRVADEWNIIKEDAAQ